MRKQEIILIVISCVMLLGLMHITRNNSKVEEQTEVVAAMEALIMPDANTFTPEVAMQLLLWITIQEKKLEKAYHQPLSLRARIEDSLQRLAVCRAKLEPTPLVGPLISAATATITNTPAIEGGAHGPNPPTE